MHAGPITQPGVHSRTRRADMALHIKYIIVSIVKYRILSYSRHGIKAVYALKVAYIYVYIIVCNISIGVYIIVQTYAYIDSINKINKQGQGCADKMVHPCPCFMESWRQTPQPQ